MLTRLAVCLFMICSIVTAGSNEPRETEAGEMYRRPRRERLTPEQAQAAVDLELTLGIGHEYGSHAEVMRPAIPHRMRPKRHAGDRMRHLMGVIEATRSSSGSNSPRTDHAKKHFGRANLALSMNNDVEESPLEQGEISHCSGVPATVEEDEEVEGIKSEVYPGYQRTLPDGTIAWVPTRPVRLPNGRPYAGWFDGAKPENKTKIANYLEVMWGYSERKEGIRQTRRRMSERIGKAEAKHLLEKDKDPDLAEIIANSTAPTRRHNTHRGKKIMESLQEELGLTEQPESKLSHKVSRGQDNVEKLLPTDEEDTPPPPKSETTRQRRHGKGTSLELECSEAL